MQLRLICKYCNGEVDLGPGAIKLEGSWIHEECWQMSGDDGGAVKEIHKDDMIQ